MLILMLPETTAKFGMCAAQFYQLLHRRPGVCLYQNPPEEKVRMEGRRTKKNRETRLYSKLRKFLCARTISPRKTLPRLANSRARG